MSSRQLKEYKMIRNVYGDIVGLDITETMSREDAIAEYGEDFFNNLNS